MEYNFVIFQLDYIISTTIADQEQGSSLPQTYEKAATLLYI